MSFRRSPCHISVVAFAILAASCEAGSSTGGSGEAGRGGGAGGAEGGGHGGSGGAGTTGGRGGGAAGSGANGGAGALGGVGATGGAGATGGGTAGSMAGAGGRGGAAGSVAGRGGVGGGQRGGAAGAGTGGPAGGGSGGAGAAGTGGGGGGVINPTACSNGTAQSGDVTVSLSSLQQNISGFGVSSAWAGSYANASDPDYLWSTTKGAGLTLLRIRYGDGLTIAKSAAQNGVTVWMTPWGTGTNGATGGSYTTTQTNPNGCTGSMPVLTNPTGLASALVTWVQNAKTQGVPIYAVSAENEPDSCGINSTTSYSAAQLAAWIDVLGPAMAAINVKIMGPETMNACGFTSYFNAIKNDAAAWNAVSIFASHDMGAARCLPNRRLRLQARNTGRRRSTRELGRATRPAMVSPARCPWPRRFTTTSPKPTSTRGTSGGCTTPAVTAAASTTRARKRGPSASGSWATTRASSAWLHAGFHLRNRTVGGPGQRVSEPGGWDRGRGRHQQQHDRHPALALRFGRRPLQHHAVGDVGHRQPRRQERHHGQQRSLQRDADPQSVTSFVGTL